MTARTERSGTGLIASYIDEVEAAEGEYLDVGAPLADGDTVPVVVTTLAFGG